MARQFNQNFDIRRQVPIDVRIVVNDRLASVDNYTDTTNFVGGDRNGIALGIALNTAYNGMVVWDNGIVAGGTNRTAGLYVLTDSTDPTSASNWHHLNAEDEVGTNVLVYDGTEEVMVPAGDMVVRETHSENLLYINTGSTTLTLSASSPNFEQTGLIEVSQSASVASLDDIGDVDVPTLDSTVDDYILSWDNDTSRFVLRAENADQTITGTSPISAANDGNNNYTISVATASTSQAGVVRLGDESGEAAEGNHTHALGDLSNVSSSTAADGQSLVWDSDGGTGGTGEWTPGQPTRVALDDTASDVDDYDGTTITDGQVLQWDNDGWAVGDPRARALYTIANDVEGYTALTGAGAPDAGQALVWVDGASAGDDGSWQPRTIRTGDLADDVLHIQSLRSGASNDVAQNQYILGTYMGGARKLYRKTTSGDTEVTDTTDLSTDTTNFTMVLDLYPYEGIRPFESGTLYSQGAIIRGDGTSGVDGAIYVAETEFTTGTTFDANDWFRLNISSDEIASETSREIPTVGAVASALNGKLDEPSGGTGVRIVTWDGTDSGSVRLGALASLDSINVSNTTTYDYTDQSATNTLNLALAELYAEEGRAHEQGDIAIVIWSDGTNSHTETLIFTGENQDEPGTSTASDWTDISADLSGKVDVDSSITEATTILDSDTNFISNIAVNNQGLVTSVGAKTITDDDIPTLPQSKISGLGSALDGKLGNIVNGSASNTNYDVPAGDIFWRSSDAVYWNTGTTSARVEIDSDGVITWPSPDPFEQLSHANITVRRNPDDGTLDVNSSNGMGESIPFATPEHAGIVRFATNSGLDLDSAGRLNLNINGLVAVTAIDETSSDEYVAVHTSDTSVSPTADTTRKISIPDFIDQIQGQVEIAGTQITSGTVAANRIDDLGAGKITSGEFTTDRIPNLDAGKITSGEFTTDRIPNLNASKINAGEFTVDRIPNLNASKINAGEFTTDRIPNLDAGKITSGEFTADRIPDLNASKITAGELSNDVIPSGITRDSEFSSTSTSLTYPGGTFTPDVGEDNQTITTGDGLSATNSGTSEDITINVDLATDSGLAFYSGELGASFQDEQISTTQAGRNLIARGNHNHDNRYLVQGALDHFEGTLDTKLETLIENLATNEGRVREKLYEHFEVADNVFSITAVPDGTGGTINEIEVDTTALPSGVSPLAQSGGTATAPAGVILENDHNNQVYFQSHVDTFSTVARQGNNYADSTVIADGLESAFNNLSDSSSAEYAIVVGYYTAGSGEWNEDEALLFEVPANAGNGGTQQVDWVCRSGILPVSAQFDEAFVFFFDGDPGFRTHAAGTVRISLTNSGQFENLASRFTSANSSNTTLNIAFTERDGTNHEETILTTSARPNFREWDHWGPYLDVGINNEATTVFEVEPGSFVSIYETQSITIHETPNRVNILDTDNTAGATELNWYAPTRSLATSTNVSSSATELTISSGSSPTLTANNRYFIRTGNDIGGLDAGEWYSARYLRSSSDEYIFDTIRDVHGDSVTLTSGTEIETSLWQVFDRTAAVTRGSGGDVIVQDEGTALTTAATTLNFTGDGVTAEGNGAIKTIRIPGGGEIDNDATAVRAAIFRGRNDRRAVPRSNPFVRNVDSSNIIVSGTGDNVTWNLSGIPSADLTEANFPASSSLTEPDVFWGVNVTSSSNTAAVPLGLYHAYASDSPNNIIESTNEIRLVGAQPIDGTDYESPTAATSSCDYQIIRLTEIDEASGGSTVNVDSSEVTNANFIDSSDISFEADTDGDITATINDDVISGHELDVDFTSVSTGTSQFLRVSDTGALSLTSTTSTGISSLSIDTDEDGTAGTLTSSDGSFGIAGDGIVQTEVTGTDVVVSLNTSSFSSGDILSVDASGNIVAGTATTVESTENTFVLGGRAKRRNVDSGTTYVTSYIITDGGGSDLDIEVVTNSRARGSNTIQERRIGFNGVSFNQAILNVGFFHGLRTDTSIAASEIAQIAYIRGEVGYNNTGTAYTDTSVTPRPNADGDLELQGFNEALRLSAGLVRFRVTATVGDFAANTDYTASMTRVSQTMTLTNIRDANGDSVTHGVTSSSPSRTFTVQNIAVENEGYFGAIQGTAPYTYTNK